MECTFRVGYAATAVRGWKAFFGSSGSGLCRGRACWTGAASASYAVQAGLGSGWRVPLRNGLIGGKGVRRLPFIATLAFSVSCSAAGRFAGAQVQAAAPGALCTTQSAMTGEDRQRIADTALAIATAIKGNDAARVQSMTASSLAANFGPTAYIVQQTSAKISADTLRVTQIYRLDASSRKPGDTTEAEFSCALSGSTGEVDFGISGLPPGVYVFAMVEATGDRPYLLAMLLEQQGSAWKMAGFYPHPRTAAGHDGLWYWTTARTHAKAGQKWLAWVLYGEADQLLRPANFVSTSHLDQLRTERRTNAPGELSDGVSEQTPLVIKAKDGTEFHLTDLSSAATDDGRGVDLVIHYRAEAGADPAAARVRNTAAAKALLTAHPELRNVFTGVSVLAQIPGQAPFATEQPMTELQ